MLVDDKKVSYSIRNLVDNVSGAPIVDDTAGKHVPGIILGMLNICLGHGESEIFPSAKISWTFPATQLVGIIILH